MNILTITGGSLYTNCYMAWEESSHSCVLVDPGFDPEQILAQVRAKGKTVEAILLTHGHFDHVGGVRPIAEATSCKVYIHREDMALPNRMTLGTIPCTDHYDEGDVLELAGLKIQVMHTPGHTPGGVCLLCQDAMFAGDTLFAGTCGRTDLPGSSYSQMLKSLARLAALDKDYRVLSGHGEESTLRVEKQINPYLQGVL